jgi:hypothetical protein
MLELRFAGAEDFHGNCQAPGALYSTDGTRYGDDLLGLFARAFTLFLVALSALEPRFVLLAVGHGGSFE